MYHPDVTSEQQTPRLTLQSRWKVVEAGWLSDGSG